MYGGSNTGSNQEDNRTTGSGGGYFSWFKKMGERQPRQQSSNKNKMQKQWSMMNRTNIMSRFSSQELGCRHKGDRISIVGASAKWSHKILPWFTVWSTLFPRIIDADRSFVFFYYLIGLEYSTDHDGWVTDWNLIPLVDDYNRYCIALSCNTLKLLYLYMYVYRNYTRKFLLS